MQFHLLSDKIKHIELRTAGAIAAFEEQGVKGKQVKILYDLVTVSKECMIFCLKQPLTCIGLGRRLCMLIGKSGNLPAAGTGI